MKTAKGCDRDFFELLMSDLSLAYRQRIEKKVVDEYYRHLKTYAQDRLATAFKDIVEIEEFFPTVAVILKHLRVLHEPEEKPWPSFRDIPAPAGIARDSLALVFKQLGKEPYSKEEYCQEMMKLHEKYPNAGFNRAAQEYTRKVGVKEGL